MTTYEVYTPETAPEGSKPVLEGAKKAFGFVPNLLGTFAESPALLKGYTTLGKLFEETSFTPTERQVVLLSVSLENGCEYCMAAHSTIAAGQDVPREVVDALRAGTQIHDARLEALSVFTRKLVQKRGWVEAEDVDAFLAAGYTRTHVMEAILGVGMKTLSNYTNHVAGTPLDAAFEGEAWHPPHEAAAS